MVWVAICYQSNAIRKFNRLLGYADSKDCHAKQHRKTKSISPLPNTLLHRIYDTDGSKWWSIGANTHDGMCSRGHKKLWSVPQRFLQADINNNNSHDNVYGAVIMTKVIAGVHPVHLMDVDWAAANPQTKPVDLGCESAENWQLSSTSTVAIVIITQPIGWYSFYRPTKGGRLSRPEHCSKGA